MNIYKLETEAKFIIPDTSVFTALQEINRVGDFELKPIGSSAVVDRYLDTAARHMYQAGFACRIRAGKAKQVLTLKSLTPAEGNLHRRQEIEQEIAADQPEAWTDGEAKKLVLNMVGTTPLETLFVIHQTRHQYHALLQGQPVIEFSLDQVSLNDAATIDYYGLEAELIGAGTETDLLEFIKALKAQWPLQPDGLSKFERALANLNQ